jgi:phospholipid/cholesterol/gamma-HCH transport system permease protein
MTQRLDPFAAPAAIGAKVLSVAQHAGAMWHLFVETLFFTFVGPFTGRTRLRDQLFPMMRSVGVKSFAIVALVSFLTGAILVLQTGEVLKRYGQVQQIPGVIALSMTRELGPLMTAIVLTARVGASFTAVLAAMKTNDEVLALRSMAIHPTGYLVAPRFVAMLVMTPCLTVFSYPIGFLGGQIVAQAMFDIGADAYVQTTIAYLSMTDVYGGLLKALVFGALITIVACHFGLRADGGPMGIGRFTMVSVVTILVLVIVADALLTAFVIEWMGGG